MINLVALAIDVALDKTSFCSLLSTTICLAITAAASCAYSNSLIPVVQLKSIDSFDVEIPASPIISRDIFDLVVADHYHATVLKCTLLDPATVHPSTVHAPEIQDLDAV